MNNTLDFASLGQLMPMIPYLLLGVVALFLAAGSLLFAPTLFLPNVGTVKMDDFLKERRKPTFGILLVIGTSMLAAGWWSFTQAAEILGSVQLF